MISLLRIKYKLCCFFFPALLVYFSFVNQCFFFVVIQECNARIMCPFYFDFFDVPSLLCFVTTLLFLLCFQFHWARRMPITVRLFFYLFSLPPSLFPVFPSIPEHLPPSLGWFWGFGFWLFLFGIVFPVWLGFRLLFFYFWYWWMDNFTLKLSLAGCTLVHHILPYWLLSADCPPLPREGRAISTHG